MTEKQTLHQYCQQLVQARLEQMQAEIKNIQQSANEETKSSAGDKYETGRAMAQLELERMMTQRRELEKLAAALNNINPDVISTRVQPGVLVSTTNSTFYVSASLGQVKCNNKSYFVVSTDSPIAKLLMGKQVGDSIVWNGTTQLIQGIE